MQRITVTCEQMYEGEDVVTGTGVHSSSDMGLDGWRYAITAAVLGSGFSIHNLNQMILEWADEISPNDSEELINIPAEFL